MKSPYSSGDAESRTLQGDGDFVSLCKLTDEELLECLHRGKQDALTVLFKRYHRLVLNIAFSILRDTGEAEDVMQEVFFEAYRMVRNFDSTKGTAKSWLLRYAYYRSLNRRRYLKLRKFYDPGAMVESTTGEVGARSEGWNGLALPECARLVEQGLATLSENQRKTLELAYFQGFVFPQIADHLGESLPNVRHHFYRGLRNLQSFLEETRQLEPVAVPVQESTNVK